MSIVCETPEGWLLDHKQYIDNIYKNCRDLTEPWQHPSSTAVTQDNQLSLNSEIQDKIESESHREFCSYVLNDTLFDIHDQFRMDSCFEKMKQEAKQEDKEKTDGKDPPENEKPKRKRKKRPVTDVNDGVMAANMYHMQVKDTILRATHGLRVLGRQIGYFKTNNYKPTTNNREARAVACDIEMGGPPMAEWCEMSKDFTTQEEDVVHLDDTGAGDARIASLVNIVISHPHPTPCVRLLMGETYLVPPQTTFLMSDISNTAPLAKDGRKYDLVVMDPPWYNKSVKRQKKYRALYEDALLDLPVVCARDGLVVVWTTNRAAHHNFIKHTLLPHWGATHVATWHWAKVTQTGEFVTPMDSTHGKRCYETLILGRVTHDVTNDLLVTSGGGTEDTQQQQIDVTDVVSLQENVDVTSQDAEVTSHQKLEIKSQKDADLTLPVPVLPDQKVIVSVPCSLHSSKPPLHDVLQPYLPPTPRCLELFARSLQPGWTSWGNEVLKVQHSQCYHKAHVS